ncbi:hypothetical protein MN202_09495 [Rheinheimera muenzenbergensis]|uniref:Thiazole/oxazole-forming peptide maturase, SagD family component n=1 Tax=Rheinheimera muenzenbergensis TaxID=1193628 RepID=A0ABU8C7A7_9GAMM
MESLVLNCIGNKSPGIVDTLISSQVDTVGKAITNCYLLVTEIDFLNNLKDSEHDIVRQKFISRLCDASLFIIYYCSDENDYIMFDVRGDGVFRIDCEQKRLVEVRQNDLLRISERHSEQSYLKSTGQYHFATPSHKHTNVFFRLGDSIQNKDELDRIAFWLLQQVESSDFILIDSWSIAALPLRAMQLIGKVIPFEALPAHPAKKKRECYSLLKSNSRLISQSNSPLLIVSVVSSGSLIQNFTNIVKSISFKANFSALAVYSFEEKDYSLCKLAHEVRNYDFNDCEHCKSGSKAIEIHPSAYYIKDMRDAGVCLKKALAEGNRAFFDKYSKNLDDLLFFHKGDPDKNQKHYAYFIDYTKLLSLEQFRQQIETLTKVSIAEKATIVCLRVDYLVEYLKEIKDCNVIELGAPSHIESPENIKILLSSNQIVVYESTVINGEFLTLINTRIRENNSLAGKVSDLLFLTGLFRPSSKSIEQRLNRSLAYKDPKVIRNFKYIEMVVLPDPKMGECPWCVERNSLKDVLKPSFMKTGILDLRLELLSSLECGIRGSDALFHFNESTKNICLGNESYLAPMGTSIAGVVAAVASGVQLLRENSDEKNRLAPRFPYIQSLSLDNFTNFDEGLIRAAFIRVATSIEFGMIEKEKIIQYLISQMGRDNQELMVSEYFLAMICGKFPANSHLPDEIAQKVRMAGPTIKEYLGL